MYIGLCVLRYGDGHGDRRVETPLAEQERDARWEEVIPVVSQGVKDSSVKA
jgi:hypothetical protein